LTKNKQTKREAIKVNKPQNLCPLVRLLGTSINMPQVASSWTRIMKMVEIFLSKVIC
jgi:hypothetical protein